MVFAARALIYRRTGVGNLVINTTAAPVCQWLVLPNVRFFASGGPAPAKSRVLTSNFSAAPKLKPAFCKTCNNTAKLYVAALYGGPVRKKNSQTIISYLPFNLSSCYTLMHSTLCGSAAVNVAPRPKARVSPEFFIYKEIP